jgi:hypothetical protein
MQIERNEYNPEQHDVFKALSVKQPFADLLTIVVSRDESGNYMAEKTIEVRTRNTNYRGDILVCSSARPVLPGLMSGVTCGFVELYDVKPVEEFTEQDWRNTCIPPFARPKTGYGWMMRNPRRVVEMPIKGQLGVYNLIVPKGDITIYPQEMAMGADGWETVQKRIKKSE